jgi:hypothetical protein
MAQKVDTEEIVGFPLVPIGAGEPVRYRRDLRVIPRNTAANYNSNPVEGMEIVIYQLHLAGGNPINASDRIQREAFPVEFFGGGNYLVGLDNGIQVIATQGVFDCLKRDRNAGQQAWIGQRREYQGRWSGGSGGGGLGLRLDGCWVWSCGAHLAKERFG